MSTTNELWNCLNCRRRKLKCDRQHPCINCTQRRLECVFPTSGRTVRQPNSRARTTHMTSEARKAELMDRIRRLEGVIDGLNNNNGYAKPDPPEQPQPQPPPGKERPEQAQRKEQRHETSSSSILVRDGVAGLDFTSLFRDFRTTESMTGPSELWAKNRQALQEPGVMLSGGRGGGLYVRDRFWATVQEEVKRIRETFEELEEDEQEADFPHLSDISASSPPHDSFPGASASFVFNSPGSVDVRALEQLRPLPPHTLFIWQLFIDNVDPFFKVLHVPTMSQVVQESKGQFGLLDASMEALMFSIAFAAVTSLPSDEVVVNFNMDKSSLMSRFRQGTECALSRADFIHTTELSVVQAMAIYLYACRRYETMRFQWCMEGMLFRIAAAMGLHRDGTQFPNLSPFEVEMRRRVWWHICFLDFCSGDIRGSDLSMSDHFFDTHLPTNVEDADLDPDMKEPPVPKECVTRVTLCLLRCDTWRVGKIIESIISRLGTSKSESEATIMEKLAKLEEAKEEIFNKYMKFLHPETPVESLMITRVKVFANKFNLLIDQVRWRHLSGSKDSLSPDRSFELSMAILKDTWSVTQNEVTKRVAWQCQNDILWQPLAVVMHRLGYGEWDHDTEDAWQLAIRSLDMLPRAVKSEPLWYSLCVLISKAQSHRHKELEKQEKETWRLQWRGLTG
ncbi:Transcription factor vrtR1-like protein [Cladobotryum mycophilum]|uniref:Transcription factor vrtR1-like protein n=1 Tax=Cladobotryum mycophilum TaxID=491253 RepID=A0ABR0SJJ7_9HYPO